MENVNKKDSNIGFGIVGGLILSAMMLSLTACDKKDNAITGGGMYYRDGEENLTGVLVPYGSIMVDAACIPCPNIIECFGPPDS